MVLLLILILILILMLILVNMHIHSNTKLYKPTSNSCAISLQPTPDAVVARPLHENSLQLNYYEDLNKCRYHFEVH